MLVKGQAVEPGIAQTGLGEEPTANSLHPSRAILFQHGGQFYREEGEHCWGGFREGDTGSLRLPSMVPSDAALAPHLQTPLSKTEGLPFFLQSNLITCLLLFKYVP